MGHDMPDDMEAHINRERSPCGSSARRVVSFPHAARASTYSCERKVVDAGTLIQPRNANTAAKSRIKTQLHGCEFAAKIRMTFFRLGLENFTPLTERCFRSYLRDVYDLHCRSL